VIFSLDGNIFWLAPEGIKVKTNKNRYFKAIPELHKQFKQNIKNTAK